MDLFPHATTAQLGTGNQLIEWRNIGGSESDCPPPSGQPPPSCVAFTTTVPYVFATVPALVSCDDDGPGGPTPIPYPLPPVQVAQDLPVADGLDADDDVQVTLTFWRPQRRPIGEGPNREACLDDLPPCKWIDTGRLVYSAQVSAGQLFPGCPPTAFSEDDPNTASVVEDDPNLTPSPPPQPGAGGFSDLAPDQPASRTNTFSYTLNLTQCLASAGASFNPGEVRSFSFPGITTGAVTAQALRFKRQS